MSRICDTIKQEDVKKELDKLINKSEIDEREHLLKFCSDNDKVMLSPSCKGGKISIEHKELCSISCPMGTKEIGEFHTHLSDDDEYEFTKLSYNDILGAAQSGYESTCIGYKDYNTRKRIVKCFDYPFNVDKHIMDKLYKIIDEKNSKYMELKDKENKYLDKETLEFKNGIATKEFRKNITKEQKNEYILLLDNYKKVIKNLKDVGESNELKNVIKRTEKREQKESCIEIVGIPKLHKRIIKIE